MNKFRTFASWMETIPLPSTWTISPFSSLTLVLIALSKEVKKLESLAMLFVHPLSTYHTSFEPKLFAWVAIKKCFQALDCSLVRLTWWARLWVRLIFLKSVVPLFISAVLAIVTLNLRLPLMSTIFRQVVCPFACSARRKIVPWYKLGWTPILFAFSFWSPPLLHCCLFWSFWIGCRSKKIERRPWRRRKLLRVYIQP